MGEGSFDSISIAFGSLDLEKTKLGFEFSKPSFFIGFPANAEFIVFDLIDRAIWCSVLLPKNGTARFFIEIVFSDKRAEVGLPAS